jgi:hypothetical protein
MTIKITICASDEHVANQYPKIATDASGNDRSDFIAHFVSAIAASLYSTLFEAVSPDYDAFEMRLDSSFANWHGGKCQHDVERRIQSQHPIAIGHRETFYSAWYIRHNDSPLIMRDIIHISTATDAEAELLLGLADAINHKLEAVCKTAESRMLAHDACSTIDEAGISRREFARRVAATSDVAESTCMQVLGGQITDPRRSTWDAITTSLETLATD